MTCGIYGECTDFSGEIACNCYDGYFDDGSNLCISPCEDINCAGHGRCIAESIDNIYCECDDNYQDIDNNLQCSLSCEGIDNCGESGTCSYEDGNAVCLCADGYQDNDDDGRCSPDCSALLCDMEYQVSGTCSDISGFPVCDYTSGFNGMFISGNTGSDEAVSSSVDSFGNLYITGYFTGTVDFDHSEGEDFRSSNGNQDIFITRINSNGTYGWTYTIGSFNNDRALSVITDSNNDVIVAGYYSGVLDFDISDANASLTNKGHNDLFVMKLSKLGKFLWVYGAGGSSYDEAKAVTAMNNNIYVTGYYAETVDFNPSNPGNEVHTSNGNTDIFITKLNSSGSHIWTRTTGASTTDSGEGITNDGTYIYTTGYFNGTVEFNEGESYSSGLSNGTFISKLDRENNMEWTRIIKASDADDYSSGAKAYTVATDSDNIYVAGEFTGNVDFNHSEGTDSDSSTSFPENTFVVKTGKDGTYIAKKTIKGDGQIKPGKIITGNEKLYLSGSFTGTADFSVSSVSSTASYTTDMFLITLNNSLSPESVYTTGSIGNDYGHTVTIFNTTLYLSGSFTNTVNFADTGESLYQSSGSSDIFTRQSTVQ
jgi:hypothetical protein